MTSGFASLQLQDEDVRMILAAQAHKCAERQVSHLMRRYTYPTALSDKFVIFNIRKMWEKLVLAARTIAAIKNPADICVIGAKQEVQRAVLKFAANTGAMAIAGRFTPGSFTNQITKVFKEPMLIVVSDPSVDQQAIREASYVNIPVIAFAGPTSPTQCVDIVIPCNIAKDAHNSIGLMWWLLCREVLRLRETISRNTEWKVKVDLFIYRSPEQMKADQALHAVEAVEHEHHPIPEESVGIIPPGSFTAAPDYLLDPDYFPSADDYPDRMEFTATSQRLGGAVPVGAFGQPNIPTWPRS
ncbi:hypothetical protein ACOME3_002952 [Neoechinorhynchus agilis]